MTDHTDEHLDPLLAEALAGDDAPRELTRRICALTDGSLTDALDRAIGPASVPCDQDALVASILAQTSDRPAVAGRIGFGGGAVGSALRIAAMVAVAVGAYGVFDVMTATPRPASPQPVSGVAAVADESPLDLMELEFATFALADDRPFERHIAQVSAGVRQLRIAPVWAESPDVLVDRAAGMADWYEAEAAGSGGEWF